MNCPVCDSKLREVNRMGVDIDICPDCKGVWLDRGELEKLVELSCQHQWSSTPQQPEPRREEYRQEDRREYREHHDDHDHGHRDHDDRKYDERRYDEHSKDIDPRTGRPRRRESFLSNVFDMFGGGGDD